MTMAPSDRDEVVAVQQQPTDKSEERVSNSSLDGAKERPGDDEDDVEGGEVDDSSPAAWASDVPDGGMAAWLVVLGGWCTAFCSFGWINSIGVFEEYYQRGPLAAYSTSTISWIPSLQIFFMMAMGPVVGKLYDRFGARHLIVGGTFLHVFGLMMASISTEYYQLLLSQGVCSAIGVAAIFQPSITALSTWFAKKRGMTMGVVASGSSIGGVVFPIMVSRLIATVGYGWALRTCAFLILALLLVAIATVRARPGSRGHALKPDMAAPFREFGFVMLMVGMFMLSFGIYVPITFIPVQALAGGMAPELVQYLVAILNAASLFGRLGSGIASDYVGRYNAFVTSCYATGIVMLALWIPSTGNDAAVIAFAVLFGFFSGAYVGLIGALVADISPLPEIGFRTGLIFLVASLPGLTASPIAGAIYAHSGNWVDTRIFAAVFCIAGTTAILATRIHRSGFRLLVKV